MKLVLLILLGALVFAAAGPVIALIGVAIMMLLLDLNLK